MGEVETSCQGDQVVGGGEECESRSDFEKVRVPEEIGNFGNGDGDQAVEKDFSPPRDENVDDGDTGDGLKEAKEGFCGLAMADEGSDSLILEQGFLVEASNVGNLETCSIAWVVDDSHGIDGIAEVERGCSPCGDYSASICVGDGLSTSIKHLNEEESGNLIVDKILEEHTDFPGSLPIKTSGGDGIENSSGNDVALEGKCGAELFAEHKCCSTSSEVSLRSEADGLLVKVSEETIGQAGEFSFPSHCGGCLDVCTNSEAVGISKRSESMLDMEKIASNSQGEEMLCCKNGNKKDHYDEENRCSSSETTCSLDVEHKETREEGSEAYGCDHPREVGISISLKEISKEDEHDNFPTDKEMSSSVQVQLDKEASFCAGEKSSVEQPSHLTSSGESNNLPNFSLSSELHEEETDTIKIYTTCSSNQPDYLVHVNGGELVKPKAAALSVFRRRNPKRAASSRNMQSQEKPDYSNRTRNCVGKVGKAVDMSTSLLSSSSKIPNQVTKKRSCCLRKVPHSVWGRVENLINIFKQNSDFSDSDPTWPQIERLKKRKSSVRGKGRQTGGRSRKIRLSRTKSAVSMDLVHVKDQMHLIPVFPDASMQKNVSDCTPNLNHHATQDIHVEVGETAHTVEDKCMVGVKLLQHDGQQLDKDLESSLTQETSSDNTLGECPGFSSNAGFEPLLETLNGRDLLDPGSSPDSDVYHPIQDAAGKDDLEHQRLLVPDVLVDSGLHATVLTSSRDIVSPASPSMLDLESQTNIERGKNSKESIESSDRACFTLKNSFNEEKVEGPEKRNRPRKSKSLRRHSCRKQNVAKDIQPVNLQCSKVFSRKGSKFKTIPTEPSVLGMTELEHRAESTRLETCMETLILTEQDTVKRQSNDGTLGESFPTAKIEGVPRSIKKKVNKGRSGNIDPSRRKRQYAHRKTMGQTRDLGNRRKTKGKGQLPVACQGGSGSLSSSSEIGTKLALTGSNEPSRDEVLLGENACGLKGHALPQRVAWVRCDACHKWRCIPASLADIIDETNCRWTCKDNADKEFANCLIPQEKTNAEINAELELSDASCDEDSCSMQTNFKGIKTSTISTSQPASWTHIKSNLFLHRGRKTQTIDEIMVCHCKPPEDGGFGCGDECLNRMLNIECVKGTCPCGALCSNQQFQQRNYAKFKWFRCGKKGHGLQLLEDVSRGQFLIEYVGEVLDIPTYESRQRYYASRGQKHFYFMTLNGGEVIDACAKGNLGRFINHSCDPNCRTEKWMVNGEVCIGLFAMREIKKGEEVTFDYNYVRVFGAAAKKCVCGSSECRGYIGGDPSSTEVIVQGDSDEEYLEPLMVDEDYEKKLDMVETVADFIDPKILKHVTSIRKEKSLDKCSSQIPHSEARRQAQDTLCRPLSDASRLDHPLQAPVPMKTEDVTCSPIQETELFEKSLQSLDSTSFKSTIASPVQNVQLAELSVQTSNPADSTLGTAPHRNTLTSRPSDDKQSRSKRDPLKKSPPSSATTKKGLSNSKIMEPHRSQKLLPGAGSGQFEGVEEKLNELLDVDGGISKRKDAAKGYLKLLFVTAAEGDNVGGASQSTRDLSLILDALLKTKSRTVLVDIINKNGLQMLHNIMKQNRSNFHRIPIIRKLLKVLEFLALKGILTPEHITRGPPCSGMESFKDSILSLTRHNDIQVHQIARNFRDKWIPRTIRRVEPSDRDDAQLDSQRSYCNWFQPSMVKSRYGQGTRDSDAIICVNGSAYEPISSGSTEVPAGTSSDPSHQVSTSVPWSDKNKNSTSGTRIRKRKSRWDQPSDVTNQCSLSLSSSEDQSVGSTKLRRHAELTSLTEVLRESKEREENSSCNQDAGVGDLIENINDEVPPGFGSSLQVPSGPSSAAFEVTMGCLQERYLPQLSISYGIPVALVQQFGTPKVEEGNLCNPNWKIAPSIPFNIFPPLPPYPRREPNPATSSQTSSGGSVVSQDMRQKQQGNPNCVAPIRGVLTASRERSVDKCEREVKDFRTGERAHLPSNRSARRYDREYRGNNQKFHRCWSPWPREGSD
ncbi:uncharacterized protein [Typha angustifolia]|uniref:uncharacterized protein n=1 Tax=Typha angustifolia TaxID=59011 RepID=UPI003C2AE2CD